MAYLIRHRCHELMDDQPYAAEHAVTPRGEEATRLFCPRCREELILMGVEMLTELQSTDRLDSALSRIPGFTVPGHRA